MRTLLGLFLLFSNSSFARKNECPAQLLAELNRDYLVVHVAREHAVRNQDLGLEAKVAGAQGYAETKLRNWSSDPSHLKRVQKALDSHPKSELVAQGLREWKAFFLAHAEPQVGWVGALWRKLTRQTSSSDIFAKLKAEEDKLAAIKDKFKMSLNHDGKTYETVTALREVIDGGLGDEGARERAYELLNEYEWMILRSGMIPIIKLRNEYARSMGYANYYDYYAQMAEGMGMGEIFGFLEPFEEQTRQAAQLNVDRFREKHGEGVLKPWNFEAMTKGSLTEELDPYFDFGDVLERVGRTYVDMGVGFRGAHLTMDLIDRRTKTDNGFIRAMIPAHTGVDGEPVKGINYFSSNADTTIKGSGYSSTETVLHELGHHANFANVTTPSVAGSQEGAPTSIIGSEVHSTFFDRLIRDPMWLGHYAKTSEGKPIEWELVERQVRQSQQKLAYEMRKILVVPLVERAYYTMPESELTPEKLFETAREIERKLLFIEGSPRPMFTIAHIQTWDCSAYCHSYLMAEMGVESTRDHFLKNGGTIVGNKEVGLALTKAYWEPGNSITLRQMIFNLTGEEFSADALIQAVNRPVDETVARAKEMFERGRQMSPSEGEIDLNGTFTISDGDRQIATTLGGESYLTMANQFREWVSQR